MKCNWPPPQWDPYYVGVAIPRVVAMSGVQCIEYGQVFGVPVGNPSGGCTSTESEDPRRKAERTLRDVTTKLKQMKDEYHCREVEALLWPELEDCFKAGVDGREQQNNGFQKRIDHLDKLIEPPRQVLNHVSSLQLKSSG